MARDIQKLHPKLQQLLASFLSECRQEGFQVGISECLRTREEQTALYRKGRFGSAEKIVTKAQYPYSFHCWGLAFDIYRGDGTGPYNTAGNWFEQVGAIGIKHGLTWGGLWLHFPDRPHFQLDAYGSTTKELVAKYQTPEAFFLLWEASVPVKTSVEKESPSAVCSSSPKEEIRWLQQKLSQKTKIPLVKDGIWGMRTVYALLYFQAACGLRDEPAADAQTIRKLEE